LPKEIISPDKYMEIKPKLFGWSENRGSIAETWPFLNRDREPTLLTGQHSAMGQY
jgi:hypothetical protein